jgi:hypothetical protein
MFIANKVCMMSVGAWFLGGVASECCLVVKFYRLLSFYFTGLY